MVAKIGLVLGCLGAFFEGNRCTGWEFIQELQMTDYKHTRKAKGIAAKERKEHREFYSNGSACPWPT
jgi:hypothetical protein